MSRVFKINVTEDTQNESRDHFFCDICGFILNTLADHQSQAANKCCQECYLAFGESRKKDWSEGWRPEKSGIRKYINNRKRLVINVAKR